MKKKLKKPIKYDSGKEPVDLIPNEALKQISRVMDYGAKKYEIGNWLGLNHRRFIAAAYRHLGEYTEGNDKDPETNLSHIAHAAANLCFLLHQEKYNPELDDRWNKQHGKEKRTRPSRRTRKRKSRTKVNGARSSKKAS